jgi:excisionase family DNA binding protein
LILKGAIRYRVGRLTEPQVLLIFRESVTAIRDRVANPRSWVRTSMTRRPNARPRKSRGDDKKAKKRQGARPTRARGRRADYLTPTEVADRLLVAAVTVRLWASKGLLPSVTTLGGHRRFRTEDVEAFAAQHQQAAMGRGQRPSRVLIIDDDPEFSRYLSRSISTRAAGVVVDVANDGFSAGVKCEASRPDVVTLDLQMPDMDGFEVCLMLRRMFGRTKPRIVALTGFASAANTKRIMAAGADSCVSKTASMELLLGALGLPLAADL